MQMFSPYMIVNIIKEYGSLVDLSVKMYAQTSLTCIKAYTLVIQRKFKKQGVDNKLSRLVDDTMKDMADIELYIGMLQSEVSQWQAKYSEFNSCELALRKRIIDLEQEIRENNYIV